MMATALPRISKLAKRFSVTAVGPLSTSAANFLVSLLLIPIISREDYGFFAFILVIVQFSFSITNATAGTPLSIVLNQKSVDTKVYWAIWKINVIFAIVTALAVFLFGVAFSMDLATCSVAAAFGFFSVTRWFRRSAEYARHQPKVAAGSDIIYSVTMIFFNGGVVLIGQPTLLLALSALLAANTAASIFLYIQPTPPGSFRSSPLGAYREVWATQSKWALLGVITTEMTGNAYSYLVVLLAGPHAYAPIAAAVLCWRPVATTFSSMTLVERPVIAKHIAAGDINGAMRTVSTFRWIVRSVVALNAIAVLVAFLVMQGHIDSSDYSPRELITAGLVWFIITIIRTIRVPESVFIQAAQRFKELSRTSLVAAPVSLIASSALIVFVGPVVSLLGILFGEIVMTYGVKRLADQTRKSLAQ